MQTQLVVVVVVVVATNRERDTRSAKRPERLVGIYI